MGNDVLRSFSMGRTTFFRVALVLLFLKLVIFALTQSVFLMGSREYLVLSICTDVINVAVGILAALRMRDAGKSGAVGFLGCIASSYGSFLFLTFMLVHAHIAVDRMSLGAVNVLSQLTLLTFVISVGRTSIAASPAEVGVRTPVAGPAARRGATAPSSGEDGRVGLPMTWTVNQGRSRFQRSLLGPVIFIAMGAFVVAIGHYVVGILNIVIFGYFLFISARKSMALRKIGPGRITIAADGFKDNRLAGILVPWRSVIRHVVRKDTKSGKVSGVIVVSNFERVRNFITTDYKYAYFFSASGKNICLFIDVDRVADGGRIADTIRHLIENAR